MLRRKDSPVQRIPVSWSVLVTGMLACVVGAVPVPAHAQLSTQHVKGIVGLKGGSPPPPHVYIIAPLVYVYSTDQVRNSNGQRLPGSATITSVAAAGGLNVVTTRKILGGFYGFQVLAPVGVNNRL